MHTGHVSDIAKFDVIRLYLRQQFPKHHITDIQEGTSRAQVCLLYTSDAADE